MRRYRVRYSGKKEEGKTKRFSKVFKNSRNFKKSQIHFTPLDGSEYFVILYHSGMKLDDLMLREFIQTDLGCRRL